MHCPSHNWSKMSSNRADFLQTHRGVNIVPGDAEWVHSVKGFRSYESPKWKNILKISPCYFRQDIRSRDFSSQKRASCANGCTDFDEPHLIRREIERPRRGLFYGCILFGDLGIIQEKQFFDVKYRYFCVTYRHIVVGIVDCLEYLFSNLIEWNRIECKTLYNTETERF